MRSLSFQPILKLNSPASRIMSPVLRCTAASTFLVAAVGKLFDFQGLVDGVLRLGWLPESWSAPAAFVLLIAEFVVGMLLLSERGVRLGAAMGGIMAVGFVLVTSSLVAKGIREGCPCLGIFLKLPPLAMLGVDLYLVLACGALLMLRSQVQQGTNHAAISDTMIPRNTIGQRRRALPFIVTAYLVVMVAALQAGFGREQRRLVAAEHRVITLRHGDRAPHFVLATSSAPPVPIESFRGK